MMINLRMRPLLLSCLFVTMVPAVAACGGLVKDTEKGVRTTEKEISGSGAAKDVEKGAGTLQRDVSGKKDSAPAADAGVNAGPSPSDTKI
jgi:hypothetical protein